MTPNVADFKALGAFSVVCPICDRGIGIAGYMSGKALTLRDLINAASNHAQSQHPVSAPAAIKGA